MSLSFSATSTSCFGARTGSLTLGRPSATLVLSTPGLIVATSRGVVPHLSRDQYKRTPAIRCLHVPFESFLEQSPPLPTLQPGSHPLHTFIGFDPRKHILALALRDPADSRETPANGTDHVSAATERGIKKVTTEQWRTYVRACTPDIVVALTDIPWTPPPFSQKRLTKSIERSAAWLAHLLAPGPQPLNVLVHMAGGISAPARRAFANSLMETLHGQEAGNVLPYRCLDDGVAGYIFDLIPLYCAINASTDATSSDPPEIAGLLKASLVSTSPAKLRVVNSATSPHEILRLIRDVGVDMFDSKWAQEAAHFGVAFDFIFPVQKSGSRRDIGHNLYRAQYAHDFSRFADSAPACLCASCAPVAPPSVIAHSEFDAHSPATSPPAPYTRAYVHHLLQTHEMSAHALLVMHNLTVLDAFFAGVRGVLQRGENFEEQVDTFAEEYDEGSAIIEEARMVWKNVEMARGKGRLARERMGQKEI
ncbi:tRNA-guanine(15) transglycosylase-like protein [Mycena pura]|uniref:tRNA-guanine(15) transglycosylase-like protein n=1 Tax=Mycena pura TaxID=153505 RepID=A0AAD6VGV8_9AGAR|nr:tRNA-guanine(15) transglycosylase-like protein [Mycena pura]